MDFNTLSKFSHANSLIRINLNLDTVHDGIEVVIGVKISIQTNLTHPTNEQKSSVYFRTSAFKSYGHFEERFYLKNFFKVSSNSCRNFTF